jgi:putative N6-adenine-specific DNA methylase
VWRRWWTRCAALLARRIQPGAGRSFSVERWPGLTRTMSVRVRAELAEAALPAAPGPIAGSDRDAGAIASAVANAARAGVASDVDFGERAISALTLPPGAPGWVVANPPYGVRVGDADRVRDLWARFGAVLRERGRGWRVALLSPDPALERQLGIPVRVAATTTNGGIPIRLVVGEVP